jgi:uncharacterized protein
VGSKKGIDVRLYIKTQNQMNSKISPVAASERILLLDVLRGFAILGILVVNMQYFYRPITSLLTETVASTTVPGMISEGIIKYFFEGKFYVLFSMLFGYGFWLFISSKTTDGDGVLTLYIRRLLVLLFFGLAHIILLWPGDILFFYAIFGLLLILFRKKKERSLVKWGISLILVPKILMALMILFSHLAQANPAAAETMAAAMLEREQYIAGFVSRAGAIYSAGTFSQIMETRIREFVMLLPGVLFFYPVVLAMFLAGVWAARKKLFINYRENLPFFRKAFWWGLGTGLIFNSIYVYSFFRTSLMGMPDTWGLISTVFHAAGGIAFLAFYVSAFVLLLAGGKLEWLAGYLAPVGRMALTNYLLHSIICTTLFLPYGFGLFGRLTVIEGILLSLLIFGLQIPFSRYWLKHFSYGPFEWLWRSLTYGKWQPMVKGVHPPVNIA